MSIEIGPVRKLTISLPPDLLDYADREAARQKISRSRFIARVLAQMKEKQEESLAAEGYRFYAEEANDFAAASSSAVAEAFGHDS